MPAHINSSNSAMTTSRYVRSSTMSWPPSNTWHVIRSGSPSYSSPYDFGLPGMYVPSHHCISRKIHFSVHHYVSWSLPVTACNWGPFISLTSTSTTSRFGFLSYSVGNYTSFHPRWILKSFVRPFFPNIRYP